MRSRDRAGAHRTTLSTQPLVITTARLHLEPLDPATLDSFHRLVIDPHVRRYLMDGEEMPREWSLAQLESSTRSFAEHGLGLWLARHRDTPPSDRDPAIGFCGLLRLAGTGLDLELVYALREPSTGRGLATEMARAVVDAARRAGLERLGASVDAVNLASVRILERLGFALNECRGGSFGELRVYGLDLREPGRGARPTKSS